MRNESSNVHYGRLNKRFDARAKYLYKLGFRYTQTEYKPLFIHLQSLNNIHDKKKYCVSVDFVLLADSRTFKEMLPYSTPANNCYNN